MDSDTSTATMIVARSRGASTGIAGTDIAAMRTATVMANRVAGTCRRMSGRCGATCSSSSRLVKRTV